MFGGMNPAKMQGTFLNRFLRLGGSTTLLSEGSQSKIVDDSNALHSGGSSLCDGDLAISRRIF